VKWVWGKKDSDPRKSWYRRTAGLRGNETSVTAFRGAAKKFLHGPGEGKDLKKRRIHSRVRGTPLRRKYAWLILGPLRDMVERIVDRTAELQNCLSVRVPPHSR